MRPEDPLGIAWFSLPDERPGRELSWLSLIPGARVTAVGGHRPPDGVAWVRRRYRRPTRRFVEAGALGWLRGLGSVRVDADWAASLELCSLVTGQVSGFARRRGLRQAVVTWANDVSNVLYRLPPYALAVRRALHADLFVCLIHAAKEHCIQLGIPEGRCAVVHPGVGAPAAAA